MSNCLACDREAQLYQQAPEFRGAFDAASLATADTGGGVQTAAAALAQGALSGAIIGGLAAGSMKGAGTGALLAGGLAGAFGGGAMLIASSANPALRAGGALGLAVGAVALLWGGSRSYRTIKGR